MASVIARLLLTLTAVAPVLIVWAISDVSQHGFKERHVFVLIVGATLILLCLLILIELARRLPEISIKIDSIKPSDNEVVAFIVTYLLPLVAPASGASPGAILLVLVLLWLTLSTSNVFTFNPVMSAFGYHFYEIGAVGGVTYVLISKAASLTGKDVRTVGRIAPYILLDATRRG